MNSKYKINLANNGTHQIIASLIGNNHKLVLDVGCNKGYLKDLAPENVFYGIDSDSKALEYAVQKYKMVFKFDLNSGIQSVDVKSKFDIIVFGDILEHLIYPEKILSYFVNTHLNDDGIVIISLPNIAHISVRLSLLLGNFNYTEAGILDRTHLHFYTSKTAQQFIASCNLAILDKKFSSNNFGGIISTIPVLSTLLGYNLIYVCKKF
jgi:2-polyprenyl-3-methyl-5-hydroxy-6-metoxy-1,4-benzoquinol methylase